MIRLGHNDKEESLRGAFVDRDEQSVPILIGKRQVKYKNITERLNRLLKGEAVPPLVGLGGCEAAVRSWWSNGKACFYILVLLFPTLLHSQNPWTIYNTSNSQIPDNVIRAIETDTAGNVWIGTDNGLAKFDGNNWTVMDSSNSGLPVNQVRSIAFDSANHLWVGTLQAGFSVFDGTNWTNYNSTNSLLPDDQVRSITFDTNNIAWLGTAGGVVYLSDEGWVVYDMSNTPLGANNINKVFIDNANTKWIGTVNGGLTKKEGNTWTTYNNHNSGLTDNTVLDIENDIYGNLWFATPAQGLGRYDGSTWFYRLDANSSIPTNSITCLEIVKNTDVKYMGTADKGLVRWNNGLVFDSFTVNNSPIPENNITCLKRAANGKIWIGTATGGIAVFNDTTGFTTVSEFSEVSREYTLVAYPNPVTDKLFLRAKGVITGNLHVFDMAGKEIEVSCLWRDQEVEINTSSLVSGLYLLNLLHNNLTTIRRFVKLH